MNVLQGTYQFDNSLYGLKNPPSANTEALAKEKNEAKIAETAENFEAFFITKMMETMFEGVSTDGIFGGGHAEKIYRSMLLDEYGKVMAKTGRIGIKEDIMRSIIDMQAQETQESTTQDPELTISNLSSQTTHKSTLFIKELERLMILQYHQDLAHTFLTLTL